MRKLFLGILMILTGLLGLLATVCGLMFLPDGGIVIGVVPGALLLWAAWAISKAYKAADKP